MISLTSSFWMLGYLFGTVSVGAVSDRYVLLATAVSDRFV